MADKTLEEIKSDILHRAGRINPFERVKKQDVEQMVKNLTSLDNDLWGREWGKYGAKYEALGDEYTIKRVSRFESGSPAVGSHAIHGQEQDEIVEKALAL